MPAYGGWALPRAKKSHASPRGGWLDRLPHGACRVAGLMAGWRSAFSCRPCWASRPPMGRAPRPPIPGSIRACWRPPRRRARSIVYSSTNEQEGPAAVQDLHGRDRHQGRVCPRRRHAADVAHGDRVPRRAEGLGHRPDHHDQQDAAADAGADRSAGSQEHRRRRRAIRASAGTASTPTTIRPAYNTQKVKAVRAAEDLRGVRPAQGMGRQGRHRRHRQRMAQGDVRVSTASRRAPQIVKDIVATLKPVRHRRPSRAGARDRRRRILRSRSTTTSTCR